MRRLYFVILKLCLPEAALISEMGPRAPLPQLFPSPLSVGRRIGHGHSCVLRLPGEWPLQDGAVQPGETRQPPSASAIWFNHMPQAFTAVDQFYGMGNRLLSLSGEPSAGFVGSYWSFPPGRGLKPLLGGA